MALLHLLMAALVGLDAWVAVGRPRRSARRLSIPQHNMLDS